MVGFSLFWMAHVATVLYGTLYGLQSTASENPFLYKYYKYMYKYMYAIASSIYYVALHVPKSCIVQYMSTVHACNGTIHVLYMYIIHCTV